jgi:DNA-binding MarR family transcriptional regulator
LSLSTKSRKKLDEGAERSAERDDEPVNLGRLSDFVGFRLRRVQNQLSRDFAAATSDLGLRSGLFSCLALVSSNPGISQSELSKEIALDKSVTVTLVDQLEKYGWAVRERSPNDRRRHALFITPRGEEQLNKLFGVLETTENAVLHQLSAGEMKLLSELLDRMYEACVRPEASSAIGGK